MTKEELVEMVISSLDRLAPSISVTDTPSAYRGKRVLAANLPRGMFFRESGGAVIHVHYFAGDEARAAEKLINIASYGVGGELPGKEHRRRYDARRATLRFLFGRAERAFIT